MFNKLVILSALSGIRVGWIERLLNILYIMRVEKILVSLVIVMELNNVCTARGALQTLIRDFQIAVMGIAAIFLLVKKKTDFSLKNSLIIIFHMIYNKIIFVIT